MNEVDCNFTLKLIAVYGIFYMNYRLFIAHIVSGKGKINALRKNELFCHNLLIT